MWNFIKINIHCRIIRRAKHKHNKKRLGLVDSVVKEVMQQGGLYIFFFKFVKYYIGKTILL